MKTLEEIFNTPFLLLTEDEICQLDPEAQVWARIGQAAAKRERECLKHESVGFLTSCGWYSCRCKHCGKDMSSDFGD